MVNGVAVRGVYLNVPQTDWGLLKELVRKFGWQAETREQLLRRFAESRPAAPVMTDDEIMAEVRAVRYAN